MTFSRDMDFEGYVAPLDMLDMETADRLLAGTVAPADAPPGYAEVTRLLQAAWAEPTFDEIPSEDVIVARIADVVRSSSSTAPEGPEGRARRCDFGCGQNQPALGTGRREKAHRCRDARSTDNRGERRPEASRAESLAVQDVQPDGCQQRQRKVGAPADGH